jgi:hypothetical protein
VANWVIGALGDLFRSRVPKDVAKQAADVRANVYGGSTKAMAQAYGVTPRTVQRWVKGDRAKISPKTREKLGTEAKAAKITPTGMKRRATELRKKPPELHSIRVEIHKDLQTPGGSPLAKTKNRPFTLRLSNEQTAALLEANATGDEYAQRVAIAEAISDGFGVDIDPDDFEAGDYSIT